jgi:hypothetical protein
MHPLCDAIDELLDACQLYGFGKPAITFPTWEDGMVLVIRAGLPMEAPTELVEGELTVLINGVRVIFPTRDASRGVD